MIYQAIYDSPLGDISVQSDGENVTALYFVGQRYDGTMEEGSFESLESLPLWKTVKTYLMCYLRVNSQIQECSPWHRKEQPSKKGYGKSSLPSLW